MHAWIQTAVDVLVIIMAGILVLFTLGLLVLHILTTTNNKRVERIKKRIMRLLSVSQDLEYLRGQIHHLLDEDGEVTSLRDIRGIDSNRGTIAMTIVVEEIAPEQREHMREIILKDSWYLSHIHKKMRSPDPDRVGVFTKLIAELRLPDFEKDILNSLHRWPSRADNQEIGLLALFRCGRGEELISLFTDPSFQLIISFRSLQELFSLYAGDKVSLYRRLMETPCDMYIIRACIRDIGVNSIRELCPAVLPYLDSDNNNLLIDAVRTLGRLGYRPAEEKIRGFTNHSSWGVRSVAVTALARIAPKASYSDLLRCLCDREWWVRFHAAEALAEGGDHEKLMEDVEGLNDRFAYEMMRYILERNALLKEGLAS